MFRSLALGYGCTAVVGLLGLLALGGSLWLWLAFVWLAGAPITLVVAGIQQSAPTGVARSFSSQALKQQDKITVMR
ncbi:MAG: hypothetical protein AAFR00_11285 [Pseudomonadota bacterium]